jgi:hypothetical protein
VKIGPDHLRDRPVLEMSPLQARIELHPRADGRQPHAELDVLDARLAITLRVEPAGLREDVAAHSAEPSPKRRGGAARALVHEVVKEIAESGHRAGCLRRVVVGSEDGRQLGISVEGGSDAAERVGVGKDVGVNEHEHVSLGLLRPGVACSSRARSCRRLHDDQFLGRFLRVPDCRDAACERRGRISCGHDRGQPGHSPNPIDRSPTRW